MSGPPRTRRSTGHTILHILEREQHLSAEAIYRALLDAGAGIGLATVYRELGRLEKAGLVVSHRFDGRQSVYEPAPEHPHDHIICIRCQRIDEFACDVLSERRTAVAAAQGYRYAGHRMVLFGLCPACRDRD